jgi:hypothetical protein
VLVVLVRWVVEEGLVVGLAMSAQMLTI